MHRERDISSQEKESVFMVDYDNETDYDDNDDDDDEDDDDKRSISSESTCCGEIKSEKKKIHNHIQQESCDFEIWRLFQVDDQNMKDIPNSEAILEILTSIDYDGK